MKRTSAFGLFTVCMLLFMSLAAQPVVPSSIPDSVRTWRLRQTGDSLVAAGQFTVAKQTYQQALSLAQSLGNSQAIGLGYRSVGYWYESMGDYSQAIRHYQQALTLFRSNPNQTQYARTLLFVGFCYVRLNDDKLALTYFNQAIAIAQRNGYRAVLIQGYEDIAILEANRHQFDKALAHRQTVLNYYKQQHDSTSYYGALYNIGLLYKNMGRYSQSEQAFRQVLAFANRTKDIYMAGYACVSLPYALIPQHKLDEAEACCRRALAWVEQTGTEKQSLLEEINGHLSHIWEQRGDYRQALFYNKQQTTNHDSVFNAIKSRQTLELEARFASKEKELEIRQLAQVNLSQTNRMWLTAIGSVLLLIVLGVLYFLYARVRQSSWKARQQSERISLMIKEMHHRIKNNLAIISGLLYLQTTRGNDDELTQAMKIGQQRVEAMSLIHQRLYQSDQIATVNMEEYLTDLVHNLLKAYGYPINQIDLQLDIDLVELDVDIAIPLGLIVNELATNALKYAYTGIHQPALRICLCYGSGSYESRVILDVQDNGAGIDERDWQQLSHQHSFGKRLITLLSQQLDGTYEVIKQNGTLFRLQIPVARLRNA